MKLKSRNVKAIARSKYISDAKGSGNGGSAGGTTILQDLSAYLKKDITAKQFVLGDVEFKGEIINSYLNTLFLSKNEADSANGLITFLKGLTSEADVWLKKNLKVDGDTSSNNITVANKLTTLLAEISDKLTANSIESENVTVNDTIDAFRAELTELSATDGDITNFIFQTLKQVGFKEGVLGTGIGVAADGKTLEVPRLLVRETMTVLELIVQKIRHQGGQLVLSHAGCEIDKVEDFTTYWKLTSTGNNEFTVGSLARIQNFNGTNIGYLWAKVIAIGADYVHLSKTEKDGDYIPKVGDSLVAFGHATDVSRQSIVMLSAVNNQVGLFTYFNVNSFSLENKAGSWFGQNGSLFGSQIIVDGKTIQSYTKEVAISNLQQSSNSTNLLPNSGEFLDTDKWSVNNTAPTVAIVNKALEVKFVDKAENCGYGISGIPLKTGHEYSVAINYEIEGDGDVYLSVVKPYTYYAVGTAKLTGNTQFVKKFTPSQDADFRVMVYKGGGNVTSNLKIRIKNITIVEGEYLGWSQNSAYLQKRADDAIDNLEIGGVNLFGFSKGIAFGSNNQDKTNNGYITNYKTSDKLGRISKLGFNGITGDYCVSGWFKANEDGVIANVNLCDVKASNRSSDIILTTEYKKFEFIFKDLKGEYIQSNNLNGFLDVEGVVGTTVYIKDLMIERGNKPTSFNRCPEDVNKNIEEAKTAADNAQTSANTANTAINAMNDDNVFDTIEKQTIRSKWEEIWGASNTNSGSESNIGSYKKLFTQLTSSGLSTTSVNTAASNLRTELARLNLYTNSNTTGFNRVNLSSLFTHYYNAEIEGWNQVSNKYSDSSINNLEIGGVNLIDGTSVDKSITLNNSTNQVLNLYRLYLNGLLLGDSLVLSCVISWTEGATVASNALIQTQGPGNITNWGNGQFPPISLKAEILDSMSKGLNSTKITNKIFKISEAQLNNDYLSAQIRFDYCTGTFTVSNFQIEKGTKSTQWTPSITDTSNAILNAQTSADNAQSSANTANQAVGSLNEYVDGALKDGILDSSEKTTIKQQINTVNESWADFDSKYKVVIANSYLSGTPKSDLTNSYNDLSAKKTALITAINNLVNAASVTTELRNAYNTAYTNYNNSVAIFNQRLEEANKAIQDAIKKASDTYTDKAVGGIEIGTVNLLKNSGNFKDTDGWIIDGAIVLTAEDNLLKAVYNNTTGNAMFYIRGFYLEKGKTYTLAIDYISDGTVSFEMVRPWDYYPFGATLASGENKYVYTYKHTAASCNMSFFFRKTAGTHTVKNFILKSAVMVEGTKAPTNWSPALSEVVAKSDYDAYTIATDEKFVQVYTRTDYLENKMLLPIIINDNQTLNNYYLNGSTGDTFAQMKKANTSYALLDKLIYIGEKGFTIKRLNSKTVGALGYLCRYDADGKFTGMSVIPLTNIINSTTNVGTHYIGLYTTKITGQIPNFATDIEIQTCFSEQSVGSAIKQSADNILLQVGEVGLDITNKRIKAKTDQFTIEDSDGNPNTVFETDANGNPILKAKHIDADNLTVEALRYNFKNVTTDDSKVYNVINSSPSNIDGVGQIEGLAFQGRILDFKCTDDCVGKVVNVFNHTASPFYGSSLREIGGCTLIKCINGFRHIPDNIGHYEGDNYLNPENLSESFQFYGGVMQLVCVKEYALVYKEDLGGYYWDYVIRWVIINNSFNSLTEAYSKKYGAGYSCDINLNTATKL